mgnify:CR=1 FL=1
MDDLKKYELSQDPIESFLSWHQQAKKLEADADAMTLATATKSGMVSARTVLYKGMQQEQFCFYTHYNSPKGKELEENPNASVVFYWPKFQRQIRAKVSVTKMNLEDSNKYFYSRPHESQVASLISQQSEPIADGDTLLKKFQAKQTELNNKTVPYPENWGGFLLKPYEIEFFIYGENRLNHRFLFRKIDNLWKPQRLQP